MELRSRLIRLADLLFGVVAIAWLFLPLVITGTTVFSPTRLTIPGMEGGALITVLRILAWLVPLIGIWKIAGFFLTGAFPAFFDPEKPVQVLLTIASTAVMFGLQIVHAMAFATGVGYFAEQPWSLIVISLLALAYNAWSILTIIKLANAGDPAYQEYQEFRRAVEDARSKSVNALSYHGIQRRLVVSFIVIILVVVSVLCGALLNDFSHTILDSVTQNGINQVDNGAASIKNSVADPIAIDDYLALQAKKNRAPQSGLGNAYLRFNAESFYMLDRKTGELAIKSSTNPALVGKVYPVNGFTVNDIVVRDSADKSRIEFLAPVVLSKVYLGFVSLDYSKDVIFASYYRTQVKVLILGCLFVYLSIFVVYLFGRNIVIPILFLRMSVNSIADSLAGMIRGTKRITTEGLAYKDRVNTTDEIKDLSKEIGNMATVIRGIIPYISASTLKYAERDTPTTERKELTFLFTDIRGFTSLCEGMEPEDVVTYLNRYLELQTSIILKNHGDIDKFVGDEIMAMFDGPEKELNACRASFGIRAAMAKEKELAQKEGSKVIAIGIGIHTGPVVFGSIGAQDRMDFTSIGDTVNLAARLEGVNKTYGTKTLISEAVYEKVKDQFICREIDLLTVKGKSQPSRIYEVLHELKDAPTRILQIKEIFEKGLSLYRAQDWDKAEKAFSGLYEKAQDETSETFLKRIELFRKDPPPANWDGVFNLTVK